MLEINTLSSPEIVIGDEKVVVSRKSLALVVYLALNPGSCSREELADLLWSDSSQERATGNLRVVLSDVRKKIGDYLSIDRHSVSIRTSGEIWVDVHQLLGAIEENDLELAVSLYRGDFLESFYVRGASRFEKWQVIEREKIRLELVDGLSEAVQSLLKAGRSKEAIKYLVHLTALEPLLESAHRRLMQAYFENGEVSLALRQFEICKQKMSEELSVSPSEETMTLYAHIAGYRSDGVQVSSILHNLLNFKTPFIGQKGKTRELVEILSNPEARHLSLVGPGGYGKSRLAIHLAKKCMHQFADGVFWIPLQSLKEASELPVAISDAIGFIHQTEKDIWAELLDYLRTRQTLLVLDNFEHLLSGAKLVSEILMATENVKIVTTSRQKLNLKVETTYIVRGMDVPFDTEPAYERGLEKKYDAVQLFIKSALRSSPAFKPNHEAFETITRICKLVEGMPLAIELAAGWISIFSLSDIESEIYKGFGFLETKLQDVEERHRSLQAVAEGTWSLLTEAEKSVFKKLSIFKGPFTRKAARKIAGASIQDLLSLSNKSFLQKDSEGLLRIHEWLRQFGESELKKSSEGYSQALDLFSNYYLTYLSESYWEAWSGDCQRLRLEWGNISEAMIVAARARNFQLLKRGSIPFFFAANIVGSFSNTAYFFAKLVAGFEKKDPTDPDRLVQALFLAMYTSFLQRQAQSIRARKIFDHVTEILHGCSPGWEVSWISAFEVLSLLNSDWEKIYKNSTQALEIFKNLKDDYATAFTYYILASRAFGEIKRKYSQKALEIARKHNGALVTALSLQELGKYENLQGNYEKAEEYLIEAYSIDSSIQFVYGMIMTSKYLGSLAHKRGDYHRAKIYYEKTYELYDRAGIKDVGELECLLGAVAFAMKDYDLSRRIFLEYIGFDIITYGDELSFENITPPEFSMLLEHLGYAELAYIRLFTMRYLPFGEHWQRQNEKLLEEYRSNYSQEEIKEWTEKAQRIKPIELAIAIRDALSEY
jgi:predicted ATPase/DNA-binding SARP family transcriptional activator